MFACMCEYVHDPWPHEHTFPKDSALAFCIASVKCEPTRQEMPNTHAVFIHGWNGLIQTTQLRAVPHMLIQCHCLYIAHAP